MCRYRLQPTPAQELALLEHCAHARLVWNLAVEQHAHWKPGRKSAPGFAAQCRQLTEARAEFAWLAAGSIIIQQQALQDFAQAMANFFAGTHRRPAWRVKGRHEGFRVVAVKPGHVRRLSRRVGEVKVPKVGWVRFRWSRPVPNAKSCRITRDRAGRWHVAFAAIPAPVPALGTGEAVGMDRGVAVSVALSTGDLLNAPGLTGPEADRRKDWIEKTTTTLASRYDLIAIEDLNIRSMTRSAKGTIPAPGNRESQAVFRCGACGHQANADVNAARNIRDTAVGRTVAARGGWVSTRPANREPQPLTSQQEVSAAGIPRLQAGEDVKRGPARRRRRASRP